MLLNYIKGLKPHNIALFYGCQNAYNEIFNVAFRGGCVMGFCLVTLVSYLVLLIMRYHLILSPNCTETFRHMLKVIAGYGLGGSTVALFSRVGGGIYTKAADVGADLIGKNKLGLDEDSLGNPATIADNVSNVLVILLMGSDLFGSFVEFYLCCFDYLRYFSKLDSRC
jgi:Na+/H+-translocating membrane pyrophosphatase